MQWRRNQQSPKLPIDKLMEELQSFLSGKYLQELFKDGVDVPAWVWLSAVSYDSAEDGFASLYAWLDGHHGNRPELDAWITITRRIAERLISTVERTQRSIVELQQEVLVPIQLSIMGQHVGPATLLRRIGRALGEIETRV